MKFSIISDVFIVPINNAVKNTDDKNSILKYLLLKVKNNELSIIARNNDITLIAVLQVDEDSIEGQILVEAKQFQNILKNFSRNRKIDFYLENNSLFIKSGSSKSNLITINGERFPEIEKINILHSIFFSKNNFIEMFEAVRYNVAGDKEPRELFKGINFAFTKSSLILTSTDGKRMARYILDMKNLDTSDINLDANENVINIIVLGKTFQEIFNLVKSSKKDFIHFQFNENFIQVNVDNYILRANLLQGEFPLFEQVLPTLEQHNKIINIEKNQFVQALHLMQATCEDDGSATLTIDNGKLILNATNKNKTNTSEEVLFVENVQNIDSIQIKFNIKYLIEACMPIQTSMIELRIKDTNSFLVLMPPENHLFLQVIAVIRY